MKKLFLIGIVFLCVMALPKDGTPKNELVIKTINKYEMIKHEMLVNSFFEDLRELQERIDKTNNEIK